MSVRVNIVTVEKPLLLHILSVCVFTLIYPACNAHASDYSAICGLYALTISFQIISEMKRFSSKSCWI